MASTSRVQAQERVKVYVYITWSLYLQSCPAWTKSTQGFEYKFLVRVVAGQCSSPLPLKHSFYFILLQNSVYMYLLEKIGMNCEKLFLGKIRKIFQYVVSWQFLHNMLSINEKPSLWQIVPIFVLIMTCLGGIFFPNSVRLSSFSFFDDVASCNLDLWCKISSITTTPWKMKFLKVKHILTSNT